MKEIIKLEDIERNFPYRDILYKERPKSKHIKLSKEKRAAQFSPFAALTGYNEQIIESSRITEKKKILTEEEKLLINEKLNILKDKQNKYCKITYFLKDTKKSGGKHLTEYLTLKKINTYKNELIFSDNRIIKIDDIVNLEINNYED